MAKRSLLLVDSDAKSSRVLEVSLKKADFDVITAASGPEALEKAQKVRPDLVISDSELGEMDGYDFCREFKTHEEWKSIPFIFLTAQTEIEDKIRGLELGVDDYLTKPIYIKEILTRVRILLQKRDKERLELKKDGDTRFSGKLSDMGVVDLIQTIEVSRKTGVIHCRASEERQAALFFREGQVIDAEAGALQGEDAVYRLLTWSDGDFEVLFRPVRRKAVIELSTQALLMEGMRRLDEWGRVLEQIPTLDSKLEIVYEDLYERLADLPDELNQILRLFDSRRTLLDVIDASKIGDLETVEVISRLYFEGVIIEVGEERKESDEGPAPKRASTQVGMGPQLAADLAAPIGEMGAVEEELPEPPVVEKDDPDPELEEEEDANDDAVPDAKEERKSGVYSSQLLDEAILAAVPDTPSPAEIRRVTMRNIPVAKIDLDSLSTEERLAANLLKNGSEPAKLKQEDDDELDISVEEGEGEVESSEETVRSSAGLAQAELSGAIESPTLADFDDDDISVEEAVSVKDDDAVVLSEETKRTTTSAAISTEEAKRASAAIDDDDEGGGMTWGLAVAAVAIGAVGFLGLRALTGDKEESKPEAPVAHAQVYDASVASTPVKKDAATATSIPPTSPVVDAAVAPPPPDAAPAPKPKPDAAPKATTQPPVADTDAQVKALLAEARKARRAGDRMEAIAIVDEALALRKSSSALLFKAELLLSMGDSQAALEVASNLTRTAPRRAQGWRIKGLAHYELSDYGAAKKAFERYLQLAPNAKDAEDVRTLLDSL